MSNILRLAAAEYLRAGLEIIALSGKAPNGKFHPRGLTQPISGTPEVDEDWVLLERVFDHEDTTGIGILIPEGMCVVDIDTDEAASVYTEYTLGDEPATAIARTRNGLHLWFIAPGFDRSRWLGPLLLRGKGSYVVAPPSRHPDGGGYSWLDPLVVEGKLWGLDFLPGGIAGGLVDEERLAGRMLDRANRHREGGMPMELVIDDGKYWARPIITGLVRYVAQAPEGQRNSILAWASMTARDEGVSLDIAEEQLTAAAVRAGLPFREIRTTIRAAYRRGRRDG